MAERSGDSGAGHRPEDGLQRFTAARLTVSDRCAAGETEDRSGPAVDRLIEELGGEVVDRAVVPDGEAAIRSLLEEWLEREVPPRLIVTTGGTGPAPRDVTPEATLPLLDRRLPGLEEALRRAGLPGVPTAVLSRGAAGTRGGSLIINLPGSPGGVRDAARVLPPLVGHVLELLGGDRT
ncbi:MAG: MogA/MoaB family molybdenum cofactor biosynthesis protein [bacterium]